MLPPTLALVIVSLLVPLMLHLLITQMATYLIDVLLPMELIGGAALVLLSLTVLLCTLRSVFTVMFVHRLTFGEWGEPCGSSSNRGVPFPK